MPNYIDKKTSLVLVLSLLLTLTLTFSSSSCLGIESDNQTTLDLDASITTDNTVIYLTPVRYDYSASIVHDGIERTYLVHIGHSYEPADPTPLVFVLHGGGGSGEIMPAFTGFNSIADRENFVVVYPDGIENHWNDGREPKVYTTHTENTNDVGFISALIDELSVDLNIDTKMIYATGISNGGMMSHRLACELSDRIAAISPVTSNIPTNMAEIWSPSRPVSVLIINGTEDPLVPWDGGDIRIGGRLLGVVLSTEDTVRFWTEKNGCQADSVITQLSDRVPSDGTTVWMEVYSGCKDGVVIELYGIEGGGHTWPDGYQYAAESLIGKTSREFDASEIIWQFFEEHPMN